MLDLQPKMKVTIRSKVQPVGPAKESVEADCLDPKTADVIEDSLHFMPWPHCATHSS